MVPVAQNVQPIAQPTWRAALSVDANKTTKHVLATTRTVWHVDWSETVCHRFGSSILAEIERNENKNGHLNCVLRADPLACEPLHVLVRNSAPRTFRFWMIVQFETTVAHNNRLDATSVLQLHHQLERGSDNSANPATPRLAARSVVARRKQCRMATHLGGGAVFRRLMFD